MSKIDPPAGWPDVDGIDPFERLLGGPLPASPINRSIGNLTARTKQLRAEKLDTSALALPSGSASVGFLQSAVGAVSRTVQSKLRDTVSVSDFGAVGDDSTDDRAAFQRAVDAVPSYGALYIPAGKYVLGGQVNISNKCITIYGAGFLATVLRFNQGSSGFVIVNTGSPPLDEAYTITLRDLWFFTNNRSGTSTAKAISITAPAPGSDGGQTQLSLLVQDCYFTGIFKFDEWWPYAIYVENTPNVLIDRCFYQGQANLCKGDAFYAKGKSDVLVVRDSQVLFCNSGVTQESNAMDDFGAEGLIVKGTGIDDCNYGVRKLHQNSSGVGEPLLEVIGCQITSRGLAIYSVNAFDVSIHDCLIYLQGSSLEPISENPTGIRLDKTAGASSIEGYTISQCGITLLDNPSGQGTGIYVSMDDGAIYGNRFNDFDGPAIQIDGSGSYVSRSNNFTNCPTTVVTTGSAVTDQRLVDMPASGFPVNDGEGTPPFGASVISNPYFGSATAWTLGAGWTVSGGYATHATGATSSISTPVTVAAGTRYRIEAQFHAYSGGGGVVGFTGGTASAVSVPVATGAQVFYVVANPGNNAFFFESDATGEVSVASIDVRSVNT